jgi:multicomponent Na+:H+ antiporter subunit G
MMSGLSEWVPVLIASSSEGILGWLLDLLTVVALLSGGAVGIVGGLGLVRLPDFFTRIHAGGVTDTLAAALVLLGLMFQAGWSLALVKLIMILLFLWITSPTGCHALAQSALLNGLQPWGLVEAPSPATVREE